MEKLGMTDNLLDHISSKLHTGLTFCTLDLYFNSITVAVASTEQKLSRFDL